MHGIREAFSTIIITLLLAHKVHEIVIIVALTCALQKLPIPNANINVCFVMYKFTAPIPSIAPPLPPSPPMKG